MTQDNRRQNLTDELARARAALAAATTLLEAGLHADSISRSYYAGFHALRALLFSQGVEPKTHSGAMQLFNRELVRTGRFSSADNRLLAALQSARELADYDAAVIFSAADASAQLDDARRFLADATSFLEREGWFEPGS